MRDGLLAGPGKFDNLKEDFDHQIKEVKAKVLEIQKLGNGNRAKSLVAEVSGDLSTLDGQVAEMSKEVDMQKDKRLKSDWQSDLRSCKKAKGTLQENFNRDMRQKMLNLKAIQESTNRRVNHTRRNLDETEQTGAETLRVMEGQTDRYAGVVDRLKDAAGNIDEAGRTNKRIYRGQCYTKVILYSTMLVVAGGVVFFILFALKVV